MNLVRISTCAFLFLTLTWATQGSRTPSSGSQPQSSVARSPLRGTWRPASAGTFNRDGAFEPYPEYGPHPVGYLMYDPTGHMCVSATRKQCPRSLASPKNV